MFPSECVLERRVRSDGDKDLAATDLPLFILKCEDKKAEGYAANELEIYNNRLKDMKIGVRLADAPPAVSYLAIIGAQLFGDIVAFDKTVIVILMRFTGDGGPMSYLIYDAVALSLRMIPPPEHPSGIYTLCTNVSIARPCQGDASYALVGTGLLTGFVNGDSLYLWRPSSSRPWSDNRESFFPDLIDCSMCRIDTEFSFNGHAYWVDLLCGVSYCSCAAIFDDNSGLVEFGFIPLPVEESGHRRGSKRLAHPIAYRTMGVVCDSFIRFVSIDGFQNHVKLEKRTVTVWKLLGHDLDEPWEEYKLSLETLWGFEGFGDLPKDLTPMYPLLSTKNTAVVYLVLGKCYENPYKRKFIPCNAHYLLAVDMRKKIVTSVPLEIWIHDPLFSCGFSRYLCKALVGPCNDKGIPIPIPIPMMKERRHAGGNVAEAPIQRRRKKPVRN